MVRDRKAAFVSGGENVRVLLSKADPNLSQDIDEVLEYIVIQTDHLFILENLLETNLERC